MSELLSINGEVSAKWAEDGCMYPARIVSIIEGEQGTEMMVEVEYLGFETSAFVSLSDIAPPRPAAAADVDVQGFPEQWAEQELYDENGTAAPAPVAISADKVDITFTARVQIPLGAELRGNTLHRIEEQGGLGMYNSGCDNGNTTGQQKIEVYDRLRTFTDETGQCGQLVIHSLGDTVHIPLFLSKCLSLGVTELLLGVYRFQDTSPTQVQQQLHPQLKNPLSRLVGNLSTRLARPQSKSFVSTPSSAAIAGVALSVGTPLPRQFCSLANPIPPFLSTLPAAPPAASASAPGSASKECVQAIAELVDSEDLYLTRLNVAYTVFMVPMSQHCIEHPHNRESSSVSPSSTSQQLKSGIVSRVRRAISSDSSNAVPGTANPILSVDNFHTLFGNLVQVRDISVALSTALHAQIPPALRPDKEGEEGVTRVLAEIFLAFAPRLVCFGLYAAKYEQAATLLYALLSPQQKYRKFQDVLRTLETDPRCGTTGGVTLSSLLIRPIERLAKYSLLLTHVLNHTPATSPGFEPLQRALAEIARVSAQMDATIKERHQQEEMKRICSLFVQDPGFSVHHTAVLKIGPLGVFEPTSAAAVQHAGKPKKKKLKMYQMFLFDNGFAYASSKKTLASLVSAVGRGGGGKADSKEKGKLQLKYAFTFDTACPAIDLPEGSQSFPYCIGFLTQGKEFFVSARTAREKQEWLMLYKEAHAASYRAQGPAGVQLLAELQAEMDKVSLGLAGNRLDATPGGNFSFGGGGREEDSESDGNEDGPSVLRQEAEQMLAWSSHRNLPGLSEEGEEEENATLAQNNDTKAKSIPPPRPPPPPAFASTQLLIDSSRAVGRLEKQLSDRHLSSSSSCPSGGVSASAKPSPPSAFLKSLQQQQMKKRISLTAIQTVASGGLLATSPQGYGSIQEDIEEEEVESSDQDFLPSSSSPVDGVSFQVGDRAQALWLDGWHYDVTIVALVPQEGSSGGQGLAMQYLVEYDGFDDLPTVVSTADLRLPPAPPSLKTFAASSFRSSLLVPSSSSSTPPLPPASSFSSPSISVSSPPPPSGPPLARPCPPSRPPSRSPPAPSAVPPSFATGEGQTAPLARPGLPSRPPSRSPSSITSMAPSGAAAFLHLPAAASSRSPSMDAGSPSSANPLGSVVLSPSLPQRSCHSPSSPSFSSSPRPSPPPAVSPPARNLPPLSPLIFVHSSSGGESIPPPPPETDLPPPPSSPFNFSLPPSPAVPPPAKNLPQEQRATAVGEVKMSPSFPSATPAASTCATSAEYAALINGSYASSDLASICIQDFQLLTVEECDELLRDCGVLLKHKGAFRRLRTAPLVNTVRQEEARVTSVRF